MVEEVWKQITIHPSVSNFQISNLGRCRDEKGKLKKVRKSDCLRYWAYRFTINGSKRDYFVQRLVALAFVPNPHNHPTVEHIDGDIKNNSADNLRWFSFYHSSQKGRALNWIVIDPDGVEYQVYSLNEFNNKYGLKKHYLSNVYRGFIKNTLWEVRKNV